jgi:hypothetical protein
MQQNLRKDKRNLKEFFCVFIKGQTLKLGNLGRIVEGSFLKKFQRSVVNLTLSLPLFMVVLS